MHIHLPTWSDKAILAGLIAAVGYVANLVIESLARWRITRAAHRASLLQLAAVLKTMRAAFSVQSEHRDSLYAALLKRFPYASEFKGYEETFSSLFMEFTDKEREVHSLIRGITIHGLKPLNDAARKWLKYDVFHRTRQSTLAERQLASSLDQLAIHLALWKAKYETWIPDQPSHALLYLGDEKRHGIEFPHGIEEQIEEVLWGNRSAPDPAT